MDPAYDLIGNPSPPVSPHRRSNDYTATTPTQSTARPERKLKRLSLVSGAVFNTSDNPLEGKVRDAMEDNPSFASPTRGSRRTEEVEVDAETPSLISISPSRDVPSTPTTARNDKGGTPRSLLAQATPATSQTRTPTVRPGYRHTVIGPGVVSKTPQTRRARRTSRDRTALEPAFGETGTRSSLDSGAARSPSVSMAPRPTSLPTASPLDPTPPAKRTQGPLTLIEKHADLLAYIAQKEREVNDAKRTYERKQHELDELRKRWEVITARQGFHSTTTHLSGVGRHHAPVPVRRTASGSSAGSSGQASASASSNVLPSPIPPTSASSAATHLAPSSAVVEGSRRLFGHLMDSLSGITGELATAAGEEASPTGDASDDELIGEDRRATRQIRTLSLIAGMGTTAKHLGGRSDRGSGTGGRVRVNGGDGRRSSVQSTITETSAGTDTSPDPESRIEAVRQPVAPGVDFTNIWDGFSPPGKDWKEKLGNVMGVSSPTIHSSQKKASEFLTTNLTHTLDFFAQALPTPNLNTLADPSVLPEPDDTTQNATARETRLQRRPLTRDASEPADGGTGNAKAEGGDMEIPWNW